MRLSQLQALCTVSIVLATFGCAQAPDRDEAHQSVAIGFVSPEIAQRVARPAKAFNTIRSVLEQTAAIVEADVADITTSFDATAGPRTNVVLTNVVETSGRFSFGSTLTLPVFGGPLPDGRIVQASHLPKFVKGARYVIFLANHDWFFSPVLGELAFRVETVGGQEVLLDGSGQPVVGLDDSGVVLGRVRMSDPAGLNNENEFAHPALKAVAPSALIGALSRSQFSMQLQARSVAMSVATDGSFVRTPQARVWNVTNTVAAPAVSTQDAGDASK